MPQLVCTNAVSFTPLTVLSLIPNRASSCGKEIDSFRGREGERKGFIIPSRYERSKNTQLGDGAEIVLFGRRGIALCGQLFYSWLAVILYQAV